MSNKDRNPAATAPGMLYVVATPIGNLDDISRRALDVLASVDFVAAEDTRHSRKLLQHFNIDTALVAYHDHSQPGEVSNLLNRLQSGERAALISDAGTPLVSDPGYRLVRQARELGIEVLPVPGPSAVISALSVAGLPTDSFVFLGFLPAKSAARRRTLESMASELRTQVFYESPRRLTDTLTEMSQSFGAQRQVFLAREISKKFEQHFFGSLDACREWLQADPDRLRGEFVLVVRGADEAELETHRRRQALSILGRLRTDMPLKKAVKLSSELSGVGRNWLYQQALLAENEESSRDDDS